MYEGTDNKGPSKLGGLDVREEKISTSFLRQIPQGLLKVADERETSIIAQEALAR